MPIFNKIYESSGEQMINNNKVVCGCEICIPASLIYFKLNSWRLGQIEKFKISFQNITSKKIRLREKEKTDNCINEVYPNGYNQY